MIGLSEESDIMVGDEVLTCRAYNKVLGDGVHIVDGKRIYLQYEEFQFLANCQTTTGDDLLLVPEGDRFNEQLILYVTQRQERFPDVNDLVYRDDWYKVQALEDWASYAKLRIQRVDVGPDRALGA